MICAAPVLPLIVILLSSETVHTCPSATVTLKSRVVSWLVFVGATASPALTSSIIGVAASSTGVLAKALSGLMGIG